jgi:hypothetical protein
LPESCEISKPVIDLLESKLALIETPVGVTFLDLFENSNKTLQQFLKD